MTDSFKYTSSGTIKLLLIAIVSSLLILGCKSKHDSKNEKAVPNQVVVDTNPKIKKKTVPKKKPNKTNSQYNLKYTIQKVLKAFHKRDQQTLNNLISPYLGFHLLHRPGVFSQIRSKEKINFAISDPEYLRIFDFKLDTNLKFETCPNYDCGMEEWDKVGLYCDTTYKDQILSVTAQGLMSLKKSISLNKH